MVRFKINKKYDMTTEQVILQKKLTALNSIKKLYNPHCYDNGVGLSSNFWDESWAEQRDDAVKRIIDQLEKDLKDLKNK